MLSYVFSHMYFLKATTHGGLALRSRAARTHCVFNATECLKATQSMMWQCTRRRFHVRTGLQTEEARELWPTFSRDLPRQQVPFCRAPTSVSHGKSSPQKQNDKKVGIAKSTFSPWKRHFLQAETR